MSACPLEHNLYVLRLLAQGGSRNILVCKLLGSYIRCGRGALVERLGEGTYFGSHREREERD